MSTVHDFTVKDRAGSEVIRWNITKFLVNRQGEVVARFEPTTDMEDVRKAVADELEK